MTFYRAFAITGSWWHSSWLPDQIQGHGKSFPGIGDLPVPEPLVLPKFPVKFATLPDGAARRRLVLEYNRQRRKTFSQLMREADAIEELWTAEANCTTTWESTARAKQSTKAS